VKIDAQLFHPAVREWFEAVFPGPTKPQLEGWPAIARGESTLILAPTGTGKTHQPVDVCARAAEERALPGGLYFAD
jgi:superfamily II RNA helicase